MNKTMQTLRDHMDSRHWTYQVVGKEGEESIRASFNVDCQMEHAMLILRSTEKGFQVLTESSVRANPENLAELNEYVAAVNSKEKAGRFEVDPTDGTMRFQIDVECEEDEIPDGQIRKNITKALDMIGDHGNRLLRLAFGFSTAAEELKGKPSGKGASAKGGKSWALSDKDLADLFGSSGEEEDDEEVDEEDEEEDEEIEFEDEEDDDELP